MSTAADHIASIESLIYEKIYSGSSSPQPPNHVSIDDSGQSTPDGVSAFSNHGGSHAGLRCNFCKGTGFNGAFSCSFCNGTGHTQSTFG